VPAHRKPTHRPKVLAAALGTALACSGVAFAVQGSRESVRSADPVTVTSAPSSPTSSSAVDENSEVRSPRPSRSAGDGRAGPVAGRGDKAAKARTDAPTETPTPADEVELPVETPPPSEQAAETTRTADPTQEPTPETRSTGSGILGETNSARMNAGRPALSVSSCLADLAQRHAERIAAAQRLFHQDLNAVASACGMSIAGENVAMNYTGASAMVDQWMDSSGHRENLLDGRFSLIGVGVAQARDGAWYGVQVFGDR
jgi:uncharacterized protein YkwD